MAGMDTDRLGFGSAIHHLATQHASAALAVGLPSPAAPLPLPHPQRGCAVLWDAAQEPLQGFFVLFALWVQLQGALHGGMGRQMDNSFYHRSVGVVKLRRPGRVLCMALKERCWRRGHYTTHWAAPWLACMASAAGTFSASASCTADSRARPAGQADSGCCTTGGACSTAAVPLLSPPAVLP